MTHSTPIPHEFKIMYNENTGKPYEICKICHRTKDELNKDSIKSKPLNRFEILKKL